MDKEIVLITTVTLVSWGVGSFISKLATNRIGDRAVFWDILWYFPIITLYSLYVFKARNLFGADKVGIILASIAGVVGSAGMVGFYMLLSRKDASSAVPLTALYPALTALLAFIFLKESITLPKILGITLALAAIYLLSK